MPRFGFSKDDEDSKKASLFSRKKGSNNTQDDNPYAQQSQQPDPYAAPMSSLQRQQASMGLPVRGGRGGLPSGPGPRSNAGPPPPRGGPSPNANPYASAAGYGGPPANGPAPYGGPPPNNAPSQQSNGYSAGGYGASGGYGSNKYDNDSSYGGGPPLGRPPTYRSTADSDGPGSGGGYSGGGAARLSARRGGYGGMGGADDEADDSNRQALFGDAPQKYAERRQEASSKYPNPADNGGGYGAGGGEESGGYGADRELTAEEQEDEDVKRMNQETRYLRNETDQSLDRSLMIANQSIETARGTMARMYNQRERLLNVENNLDEAANHNKIAEHRAAELKHYNRSMFAVKVNNPFTSKQRAAQQAQAAIDEHRSEREQREETRRLAYLSNRNAEQNFEQLERTAEQNRRLGQTKSGISSKFNLEDDDEEDIQKEQAINQKMDLLSGAVGTLNMTAKAMNQFATEDLDHIDRIAAKSDTVDDQVRANRYRLERIEKGR
ncbi:plasma membrane snare protein [Sporothrix brasiliensis 5110]|uniref:Plasma membrane snare protein n=1 Tax=Sporothrix brasiliensis 5110 TaxID=1398154 RepID=A0A0C2IIC4_9PEZI|nr:plasma membrane snare protein [Sporothrix brasiliensis 5110]KIH86725.1 plasma membrane snare protein [Sporothrix brasiliensis 5110]